MDGMPRTAVVTGGSSGIGLAIVHRLATMGHSVASLDLARGALEESDESGLRTRWFATDVSDAEAVADSMAAAARWSAAPTIVVHCAALQGVVPFEALTTATWDRSWNVNVTGAINVVQAALPAMRAARWGRIVLMSSSSVQSAPAGMAHYVATKAALIGLARALSAELGPDGITVNALAPGLTRTEHTLATVSDALFSETAALQDVRRSGDPDDVAALTAFVASDSASFISGQTLAVNGGEAYF